MKGTGAYIYGRPCWREYGGRTTRSVCVGRGVKPKHYFNIGKRPGTLQGGTIEDDPFLEDAQEGVQTRSSYLPPELVRHIGSFRADEGERELFGMDPAGTNVRGQEVASPEESQSIIMHRLLSMDDDSFEDEEDDAHKYSKALRRLVKEAGDIRGDPDFDSGWWANRLRRKGGVEMPSPMPGIREYNAFRSVG